LTSNSGNSARSQLIKTRRGTWIDESLLPAARRECLDILREAARKAVGEATYLSGWISDATDSVEWDLTKLSEERLEWKPTPAEEEMTEEVYATIDALEDRGAFEGLSLLERVDFEFHVRGRIRSKYESRISNEAEEARKKRRRPKSNPTLITEKDTLNSVLDVLHRCGVLDEIDDADFLRAPMEEDDAQDLAREARTTAAVCGCCGQKLPSKQPTYFGAQVYVGMWALNWDRVRKPQICKPRYERTVLCGSCAPDWLSSDRDDVVTQLCAYCERPMVSRLALSELQRTLCSDPCRRAYRNQMRKEKRAEQRSKVCEVCGEEYTATRRDSKTCSDGCRQMAYRRRRKEAQQDR
jgi:predicted nucleic acid-binding Zn ribbon protein